MSEKKRESDTLEGVHKKLKQEFDRMDGRSPHGHGIRMLHTSFFFTSDGKKLTLRPLLDNSAESPAQARLGGQ